MDLRHAILSSPAGPVLRHGKRRISPLLSSLRRRGEPAVAEALDALRIKHEIEIPLAIQWAKVLSRSQSTLADLPPIDSSRVLFVTSHGFSKYMLACETTLAAGLRLRGVEPWFLICDHSLPACEWNRWGNFDPDPDEFLPAPNDPHRVLNCDRCTHTLSEVLYNFDYPIVRFSDLVRSSDRVRLQSIVDSLKYEDYEKFVYKDVSVGEQAHASVLRCLRRGSLEDTPYTRWLFKRYLLAGLCVVELGDCMLNKVQPDCMVAVHGVYITHGTLCDLARNRGIRVVVHGGHYRRDTVTFSHNESYHRCLLTEPPSKWADKKLTPAQEARLSSYLDSRRCGTQDQTTYHDQAVEGRERLINDVGIDPFRPIISLFTNVAWDAQIYYPSNVFDNMFDWIFQTISYFSRRTDVQLVIRVHPSESRGVGTDQPVVPEIHTRFPALPDNVKIIPPESYLSSYTLAEISRAALIYGTLMGLEIAVRGIPVIVAGETFARGKGFTYDANSREEYFALLGRITELPHNSPEMIERARRFAYHFFFRRMVDFPQVHVQNIHTSRGVRLGFRRLSELAPGHSPSLDAICEGILSGSDFVAD